MSKILKKAKCRSENDMFMDMIESNEEAKVERIHKEKKQMALKADIIVESQHHGSALEIDYDFYLKNH